MTNAQHPAKPKPVTMRDVATFCGVDRATVSLALRHDPRISPATTERVIAAATELGYNPSIHDTARRLAYSKYGKEPLNRAVCLLLPPNFHEAMYFAQLHAGVMDYLMEAGFALVSFYDPRHAARMPFPPIFERGGIDGIIGHLGGQVFIDIIAQLRAMPGFADRPIISLIYPMPEIPSVLTDDYAGAYQATRHLLELGHRDLLHFFNPELSHPFSARYAGMCQAMHDNGLDPDQHAVLFVNQAVQFDVAPGHHLLPPSARTHPQDSPLLAMLTAHPKVTAILAMNDPMAIQIQYLLQQAGWQVPEDISLIGFDDTESLTNVFGHRLTSVRLPLKDVGREAAHLMVGQLTGQLPRGHQQIVLPTELIIRQSTAPPPIRRKKLNADR